MTVRTIGRLAFAIAVLSSICTAGTVIGVTSQGGLGANDFVDWAQFGVDPTNFGSPVTFVSNAGFTGTASTGDPGGFLRLDSGGGWTGSFPFGDRLLTNLSVNMFPLTFTFDAPVFGAGTFIVGDGPDPYVAEIDAFNGKTLLGTFFVPGTPTPDFGTAPFLGVLDTVAEITSIQFTLANASQDFAVDSLDLVTATPEPGTAGLALAGLLAAGLYRRRRRS